MSHFDDFDSPDLDPDEFREVGYRTIDLIAEHYARVREVETLPGDRPDQVAAKFDDPLPEAGRDPDALLDDWEERIYPFAAHQGSPRWYGYVMGSGTQIGAIGDALAAAVNMNVGGWIAGPSATEIERECIRWLAELSGYPTDCGGVLTSGGTMANQAAILTAFRAGTEYDSRARGLQTDDRPGRFTLYTSAHEVHASVERVADALNLGREAVRLVPCDDDYRMDPAALVRMVDEDRGNGDVPFCVVAQVGSINVSAVDPLDEIADVCAERDLWLHADGACGAVGATLPEKTHLYAGIERADSLTLDPHKWLYVPYGCGCVLFRDPEHQARTFAMDAAYLDTMDDETYQGTSYAHLGPEMSRPFRALKLWMSLGYHGVEGYRRLHRRNLRCVEYLHDMVVSDADFETLQEPNLFIYSFRFHPEDLHSRRLETATREAVDDYLDWLNQRIADDLRLTGLAFLTTTSVREHTVLRMSICNHRTTPEDIDTTFAAIREHGERIDGEGRDRLPADSGE
jgi:glutamate/tyrosine decarboxylase-like PLP-dependent enzyme